MRVTMKLRTRLAIIAALPEPILLDRMRQLSMAELIEFRRRYGIGECHCKGKCRIHQFLLDATRPLVAGLSGRAAARVLREARALPQSMFQTRCQCEASRQPVPPIPFSAHQLLAELLLPEGEQPPTSRARAAIEGKAAEQEATKWQKRDLPWQALGELAAEKASPEDLAGALYGIVAKHPEPEDVVYAIITRHRKDASNAFKQALPAFGVTWERKTRPAEKVPA
jgi:hypothetical protein